MTIIPALDWIPNWDRYIRQVNRLTWEWRQNNGGANPPPERIEQIAKLYGVLDLLPPQETIDTQEVTNVT